MLRALTRSEVAPRWTTALLRAVTNFVVEHPGCVHGTSERRRDGDAFRRFALGLYSDRIILSPLRRESSEGVKPNISLNA